MVTTENLTGTHTWTPVDVDYTTAPVTHFLAIQLRRSPSRLFENKLSGSIERCGTAAVKMKAIRIGLCVIFAFSVLAHGVVEVWSESLLEIGASALLVLWAVLVIGIRT